MVFYNTKNSPLPKNETDLEPGLVIPQNSAIFMPMNTISKDTIMYIKNFRASDDMFDFRNRYGHSEKSNFPDILWLCSRMFTRCGYKLQASTILLFTNQETPHARESVEYKQCLVRGDDLNKSGVFCILVPMKEPFDKELFYEV